MTRTNAAALDDLAIAAADSHQATRLQLEAAARREIENADRVLEAIETLERASAQMSCRSLPDLVDRLARIHSRALERLRAAERTAARATLRTARGPGR